MAENQENIELKKLTYIYLKMAAQGCHCAFIEFADKIANNSSSIFRCKSSKNDPSLLRCLR